MVVALSGTMQMKGVFVILSIVCVDLLSQLQGGVKLFAQVQHCVTIK